jgi:2-succinyl-6-hydroxy-2,4-cyclohexadiene-1-carboxylate synthase
MPKLPINGIELNVEVSGQGPPLVALHGFTGSAATWKPLAHALNREHTMVRIDLLGHGGSSRPADPRRYSMEHTMADLVGVLDTLGLATACWLGYSMGGRIALGVALAAPERCDSLVLESASAGIRDATERANRAAGDERLAQWAEDAGIKAFVDYWESLPLFTSQAKLPQETRAALRTQRLANDPTGLANSLRGIGAGAQPAYHDRLANLRMPALLIAGEEDAAYAETAKALAAAAPDGRAVIEAEAGHAVHLERPEAFQHTVLGFLRTHHGASVTAP